MTEKDPMEIEREREAMHPDLATGLVPDAALVSSLQDPDAVEEDDLLANNPDDERDVTERNDR